jgi:Xaa-Pro aminopeptidase
LVDWTIETIGGGKTVGWDLSTHTFTMNETKTKKFQDKEVTVKSVDNLVDQVWGSDRPVRPMNPVNHLDIKYSGQSTKDKLNNIAKQMEDVDTLLITALDEIAWVLNLRGSDIEYNPVFFSYLLFNPKESQCVLFIEASKVSEVQAYLDENVIGVRPYAEIEKSLQAIASVGSKVGVDQSKCNSRLMNYIREVAI